MQGELLVDRDVFSVWIREKDIIMSFSPFSANFRQPLTGTKTHFSLRLTNARSYESLAVAPVTK